MTVPLLSVVVPTLEEADRIGELLRDLSGLAIPHEVIVVDGGSLDGTAAIARDMGARVIEANPGRGTQLAEGARRSKAPVLCFLHADVRLPPETVAALTEIAVVRSRCAFSFRFSIDAEGFGFRVIELGVRLRCGLFNLPYGDQGLVVRREDYFRAGGFPRIPLLEDVAMVRALSRVTDLEILRQPVRVSSRRWRRHGIVRATLGNWVLLLRFILGASPPTLAARYRAGGAG